jgi:23S rRNA (cytosine1962-C5)-methyltransferase
VVIPILQPKLRVKKGHDRRVRTGHLWLYSNEIDILEGEPVNGELVDVYLFEGTYFGTGFFNKNSLISIRILSYTKIPDLQVLFRQRFSQARALRDQLYPGSTAYRLIFSESDLLPGLIVDRYNDTYVLQVNSAGMEANLATIVDILTTDFGAKNIFSKHDAVLRSYEGLNSEEKVYLGEKAIELIADGNVRFEINFGTSQKTGFFYDQVENRRYIERYCKNKTVFDGFCNSGGFGLHALIAGARSVYFTDASSDQCEQVKRNLALNDFSEKVTEVKVGDIFEVLEVLHAQGKKFDVVCIDPPAFAKSKKTIFTAIKGYEKLHRLALKILADDGILVSTSCSHYMSEPEYQALINRSVQHGKEVLQLLYKAGAAPDHPKHAGMDETAYLKFLVFRKLILS